MAKKAEPPTDLVALPKDSAAALESFIAISASDAPAEGVPRLLKQSIALSLALLPRKPRAN